MVRQTLEIWQGAECDVIVDANDRVWVEAQIRQTVGFDSADRSLQH